MKIKIAVLVAFLSAVISAVTTPYPHCYGGLSRPIQDIKFLNTSVDLFRLDKSRYPTQEEGLQILVSEASVNLPKWKQYMKEIPMDTWDESYVYELNSGDTGIFVYSGGPNKIAESGLGDDVIGGEKDYSCEVYNDCLHLSEYINMGVTVIALISFLLLIVSACYYLIRLIIKVVKKPRVGR